MSTPSFPPLTSCAYTQLCHAPEEWIVAANTGDVVLGESPTWCDVNRCLYWVDIDGRRVHRSQPSVGITDSIQLDSIPGTIGLVENHPSWTWVATNRGVIILDWESMQSACIAPFPDTELHRFNDGKVNPFGDLVLSTMVTQSDAKKRQGAGKVWRISMPRSSSRTAVDTRCLVSGATIPNGLDWDPASPRCMWWIDTPLKRVDALYVGETYVDRRVAFDTTQLIATNATATLIKGEPDGMTRDQQGYLWVCMPGGSHVCRFSPTGRLVRSIRFPVTKVTALCFGGPTLTDLYVASASKGVDRGVEPLAGCIFVVPNAGRGRPTYRLQGEFGPIQRAFDERWNGIVTRHEFINRPTTTTKTAPQQLRSNL